MATRPIKLKLLPRSTIKAKSLTRFPASVVAGDGIDITQAGGTYTFSLDDDFNHSTGTLGYVLTGNGLAAASFQGFTQTGSGAQVRTWQNKLSEAVSLGDFGGVGDGATDNLLPYQRVAALDAERIHLSDGEFYAPTLTFTDIADKYFYGSGKIVMASGSQWAPGRFSKFSTTPTPGGSRLLSSTLPYAFQGDTSKVDQEYYIIDPGVRVSLDQSYFEPTVTPHWMYLANNGGSSGCICRMTGSIGPASAGTVFGVTGTEGATVGQTVAILDDNGQVAETHVIASMPSPTTMAFVGAISGSYVAGTMISNSLRTNHSIGWEQVDAREGGDSYAKTYYISGAYEGLSGQDHAFFRQTVGIDNGVVYLGADGVIGESREVLFSDLGFDVLVFADIRNFTRTNDTGAYGKAWINTYSNSQGSAYADAAHVVRGKWHAALDTGNADFGAVNTAIRLASEHRIMWGVSSTPDATNNGFWSDIAGNIFMRAAGGVSPDWSIRINGGDVINVTATRTTVPGLTVSGLGAGVAQLDGSGNMSSSTLGASLGGTGITSYAVGDIIYASGATTLSKLADVATGNALISGGVTTAPAWGKVGLTTHISGTLALGNGGLGITSGTSGGLPYFSSTSTVASSAELASNQIVLGGGAGTAPATLGSAGTTTTVLHGNASGAPTFGAVHLQNDITSILLPGAGGTGQNFSASSGILSFSTGTASLLTTIPLASGGTNANLTASNGGIFYSTATAGAILSGTATANLPLLSGSSTTPSWAAVSYPTSATSGGIPYFSSTSAMATSAMLASNQLVLGGGAGTAPFTLGSAGTTTTVLHGNAAGAPTFGAVHLQTDITSILLPGDGGTGQNFSASSGILIFAAGTASVVTTSAGIAGAISDETGSGALVFATSPALTTPNIGAATGTSLTTSSFIKSGAAFILGSIVSPAQITSNQNDYAPANLATAGILQISSDAARDITGLSNSGFVAGQVLTINNVGNFTITLKHNNGSSSAGNKFLLPSGVDLAVPAFGSARIYWDGSFFRMA